MKFNNVCETRSRKGSGLGITELPHESIGKNIQMPIFKSRDHKPLRDPANKVIFVIETCKHCGCLFQGESE